jgi:UDP-N-acetylglucosamine 4,6-dehydratase
VIPLFLNQRTTGKVTVTHPEMTRFWITLDQGVRFVITCLDTMHGGEVFVPKIPSTGMMDLADAVAPGCEVKIVGIRPGEKIHECLVSEDEARTTKELDDFFVIQPAHRWWSGANWSAGRPLPTGFRYASDTNPVLLSTDEIREMAGISTPALSNLGRALHQEVLVSA